MHEAHHNPLHQVSQSPPHCMQTSKLRLGKGWQDEDLGSSHCLLGTLLSPPESTLPLVSFLSPLPLCGALWAPLLPSQCPVSLTSPFLQCTKHTVPAVQLLPTWASGHQHHQSSLGRGQWPAGFPGKLALVRWVISPPLSSKRNSWAKREAGGGDLQDTRG